MTAGFTKTTIGKLTTVGEELVRARMARGISREASAKTLAIPVRYIEALETGLYHALPGEIYIRGWLKKYASLLGVENEEIMQRYARETTLRHAPQAEQRKKNKKFVTRIFSLLNARRIVGALIIIGAAGYIGFVLYQGLKPPTVVLHNDPTGQQTQSTNITLGGTTDIGVELKINQQVIELSDTGSFEEDVILIEGINTITVEAKRPHSRRFTKTITVVKTGAPSLQ